ncbi:hypothetical protein BOTBODRAFT_35819 [Botryobasidium botryosum FD-172 SS1]|uniref:Uncharacterized protein n=1 Tax=Botryobasidium botryosum (strain FD-172 SS1) TaxID=930990 RepID=A0A067M864_BOTB1|nr:hypothetical protein BOTBODRAFT_35819 [Botryobasidium botryosum FD-172 SS1]
MKISPHSDPSRPILSSFIAAPDAATARAPLFAFVSARALHVGQSLTNASRKFLDIQLYTTHLNKPRPGHGVGGRIRT